MSTSTAVPRCAQVALVAVLLSSMCIEAQVPGGGGRQRGGMEKGSASRSTTDRNAAAHGAAAVDPIAAINRELPSLKVDMKITPEQLALWDAFSASVREANNVAVNRAKRDAMARPRDDAKPDVTEAPPALVMIAALADDDAQRAEAMRTVKSKVAALVDVLTLEQRRMFDRRIALAQREPLGGF